MEPNAKEPPKPVPGELMDRLHKANEQFHNARKRLEAEMEGAIDHHQDRVDAAAAQVRAAEMEVESVTEQIGKALRPAEGNPTNTGQSAGFGKKVADLEPLR